MTPNNPTQAHARFLAVVQRAMLRPLYECTCPPAQPSERAHGETSRVQLAKRGD